ncbi:HEAT repeat domain-containing protein [Paenibacillus tritici]|uniref:HEAT repeat domain-containing protein n=1 Tax=Paenibacillus tritici TaxID=1873425 RepID=A0ABX2DH51_9BACL|nr:HEAT repeat domain-containing protein [Paenibacillus tritici]NQX43944.1 HEAT repeat domain-containing protein [Paenibacillus tritici]
MSTALLQELHQEYRRLYIAGSELAAGDFRLKRLLPQFQQLGERSPVFKKIGEGIAALLEPASSDGPAPGVQLQEHTLLLESVLYTQGTIAVDGTPGPLPVRNFTLHTKQPYRKLAPVLEALSTTGSGRHEIVVDAYKEGAFQDLRLLPPAVAALSDPYSELAEYAMTNILPSYGPGIAGYLLESLDLTGGRSEVRKLEVISRVGADEYLDQIFHAAGNGSEEIRAGAIKCLGGYEQYLDHLLEWSTDKKKAIREAAYTALAAGGSAQGGERLVEAFIKKKDREMVAAVLARWPVAEVSTRLAALFMEELKAAPQDNADKKLTDKVWDELLPFITALRRERSPQMDEIYSYVLQEYARFSPLGWITLIEHAAWYKENTPDNAALAELEALDKRSARFLPNYFRAAQKTMSPKELFNQFCGTFMDKLKALVGKEAKDAAQRSQLLIHTIEEQTVDIRRRNYQVEYDAAGVRQYSRDLLPSEEIAADWDPRWLDWFIKQDAVNLAGTFARPGHQGVRDYLIGKLKEPYKRRTYDYIPNIFKGLERAGVPEPERLELLMTALENNNVHTPYTFEFYLVKLMERFPASYASRLEAVVPKYRYECKQQLEYVLNSLRSAK